jgi:hypothetical protein
MPCDKSESSTASTLSIEAFGLNVCRSQSYSYFPSPVARRKESSALKLQLRQPLSTSGDYKLNFQLQVKFMRSLDE